MVPDHLVDDEPQELFPEFRIELGLLGQRPQAGDLSFLALRIGGRHGFACFVSAHRLSDAEAFGEHVDKRGVDVVDALAVSREHWVGGIVDRGAQVVGGGVIHWPIR